MNIFNTICLFVFIVGCSLMFYCLIQWLKYYLKSKQKTEPIDVEKPEITKWSALIKIGVIADNGKEYVYESINKFGFKLAWSDKNTFLTISQCYDNNQKQKTNFFVFRNCSIFFSEYKKFDITTNETQN